MVRKQAFPDREPLIVAEVGINHNGDMELAREHIRAAVRAGADAVKFQNYRTEDFISDESMTYSYENDGRVVRESQYEMFKRCELSRSDVAMLAHFCREQGVAFISTPTNEEGVRDLVDAGAVMLKNGSDYLQHLPLIRSMAQTGLPVCLSVGMADRQEIEDAVTAFREAGGRKLTLLQCTSSYPTPPDEVHLRKMETLRNAFRCPVGLSDHSEGIVACLGAAAPGATVLEKHFTLDRNLPGPDHRFSMDETELGELVRSVHLLMRNMGNAEIAPAASEMKSRPDFRLSCVAARDLPSGHVLAEEDICFRRPGTGMPPKDRDALLGLTLARQCPKGEPLTKEVLDDQDL